MHHWSMPVYAFVALRIPCTFSSAQQMYLLVAFCQDCGPHALQKGNLRVTALQEVDVHHGG